MKYQCAECGTPLEIVHINNETKCKICKHPYKVFKNYLKYDLDSLLLKYNKKKYLLNKVLNNNGYLSYIFLKEGSLSLPERKDCIRFKNYIESYLPSESRDITILDIGCGVLEMPGYLNFENNKNIQLYGLDPIDDQSFNGFRIVGCSEFMPFENNVFDIIIFATSLDHVCSIDKSISECHRILKEDGKVIIWMSDRSLPLLSRVKHYLKSFFRDIKHGYPISKFVSYPNYTTLYIPNGAVDPFHSFFESPGKIINIFNRGGFQCKNNTYNSRDEVFLCFTKNEEEIK